MVLSAPPRDNVLVAIVVALLSEAGAEARVPAWNLILGEHPTCPRNHSERTECSEGVARASKPFFHSLSVQLPQLVLPRCSYQDCRLAAG